jgi:predicted transcriptional regulator
MLHDVSKRTTVTLDDDVADALSREARRTGRAYRDVVNVAIRRGLAREPDPQPFVVRARAMRRRPGIQVDDIEALLDVIDGQTRR